MSTYVMSDIHGNLLAFSRMLKQIEFSKEDELIIIGDLIDRGKNSLELLQYVYKAENITLLLGNHELMMSDYYRTKSPNDKDIWFLNGGKKTYSQLEYNQYLSKEERFNIISWVRELDLKKTLVVNNQKFVLCHANPFSNKKDKIVWDRIVPDELDLPVCDDTIYIIGHTPTIYCDNSPKAIMKKFYNGRIWDIDCGLAGSEMDSARLCCIRLDDMTVYYTDAK